MTHRYHPDPKRGEKKAMLYDDCERCTEQAEHLFGLDRQKLAWFWSVMHQIERKEKTPPRALTGNELTAIRRMYRMAVIFERLTGVWPSPDVLARVRHGFGERETLDE